MTTETTAARSATYAELIAQADALCAAQPGYGTPAYRGDATPAFVLYQQASRMVEETARRLVEQEVRYCVSGLIHGLQRAASELTSETMETLGIDYDDLTRLAYRDPNADDFRDAVPAGERVTVMKRDDDGAPGSGMWEWFGPNSDDVFDDDGTGYLETELEAWQSAFEANNWEVPNGNEAFEHWAVTDYFGGRLRDAGETVVNDLAGLTVWARCSPGQMIAVDSVIEGIAKDILTA